MIIVNLYAIFGSEVIDLRKALYIIKNIFCILTIIFSGIMLIEYSAVLLPYQLHGFLFEIFDFLAIFLYLGIFAVPLLLLVSVILMAIVRNKSDDKGKILNIITVVLPIIVALLMFLTDFNARLQ